MMGMWFPLMAVRRPVKLNRRVLQVQAVVLLVEGWRQNVTSCLLEAATAEHVCKMGVVHLRRFVEIILQNHPKPAMTETS